LKFLRLNFTAGRLPLIIDKNIARRVTLFWIAVSFTAAHLFYWIFPGIFETWNEQLLDSYLRFRSRSAYFQPPYSDKIVHVDLNNTSLRALNNFYPNRGHHARVIHNLARMGVAAQMYDFIFAGPTNTEYDDEIIATARRTDKVYFGMVFRLDASASAADDTSEDSPVNQYLKRRIWRLTPTSAADHFFIGRNPVMTLPELSDVASGVGYLNIQPDRDGVFRRLPLLVRTGPGFYPSFSLMVMCDYLKVRPSNIQIKEKALILKSAEFPETDHKRDIVIPIDKRGSMRINFVGPWGRMKHYNFSDVHDASDDQDEMELWQEELASKIVLVSDVSTGSSDVGKVPVDNNFPLSGIHANAVHTILTGSFFKEFTRLQTLLVELFLLLSIAIISFHRSAVVFTVGTFGVAACYLFAIGLAVFYGNFLLPAVRPLLMIFFALISLHIVSAVENTRTHAETEKAREIVERELEIGRQIQAGFFPTRLPAPPGWDIDAYFKPARQVAGDFYDAFDLGNGRYIGIVIADVCDKGVGAALFMALIRSLIRAFALRNFDEADRSRNPYPLNDALRNTVEQTNNYLAETHADANMFATLFLGILDPGNGNMRYINGGHEPPVVVCDRKISARLNRTGPAVGMMPGMSYAVEEIHLHDGELLFLYTDGLTDAQNEKGELFGRERLAQLINGSFDTADAFIAGVTRRLNQHMGAAARYDDITLVAVRRSLELKANI
jgi:serine phosphatase RsbU (regulator of sigma subunit)/CHASE2 domain-containing sensor protein